MKIKATYLPDVKGIGFWRLKCSTFSKQSSSFTLMLFIQHLTGRCSCTRTVHLESCWWLAGVRSSLFSEGRIWPRKHLPESESNVLCLCANNSYTLNMKWKGSPTELLAAIKCSWLFEVLPKYVNKWGTGHPAIFWTSRRAGIVV